MAVDGAVGVCSNPPTIWKQRRLHMSDVAIWDRAPAPRSIRGGDGRAEAQRPDRCGKTRSFRAAAMHTPTAS